MLPHSTFISRLLVSRWLGAATGCGLLLASGLISSRAFGENWNVASGNWSLPANWDPNTVPNATQAFIGNGGTVTVDSAVPNVGAVDTDGLIVKGGSTLNIVTGGSLTSLGAGNIGDGTTGTLTLSDGSLTFNQHFNLGVNGGVGLVSQTGGTVTVGSQWLAIGLGAGAGGSIYDISGGTLNTSAASLEVGADRAAELKVSGTGTVTAGFIGIGLRSGSNGLLTQTGGTVTASEIVVAGGQGSSGQAGTYNKTGGSLTAQNLVVGQNGGTGVFTLNGGGTTVVGNNSDNNHGLFVGARAAGVDPGLGSNGTVNITNGTMTMNGWGEIGRGQGTGTVNVTGPSSVFNAAGSKDFAVGIDGGTGNLNVTAGGTVNMNWWLNVARGGGSTGHVTVDGSGSKIILSAGQTNIGEDGVGTMEIKNGGQFSSTDEFSIGRNGGSNGTVTLAGATSTVDIRNNLFVGRAGTGTLNQTGGTWDMHGTRIQVADSPNSIGTINLTGGTMNNSDWFHVGSGAGATGNVNVNYAAPTDTLTTGRLYLGNSGASGTFTVNRGTVNVTSLAEIGRISSGRGTLNVTGAGSTVNVFSAGSVDEFLRVGTNSGQGTINVSAGGKLNTNNGWLTMGDAEGGGQGATGNVTIDGAGSTASAHGTIVGWFGATTGTLTVSNGAVFTNAGHELSVGRDYNGPTNSPTGIVNVNSGGILNTPDARIGHNTTGIVNINGGTFNNNAGWVFLGEGGASNGTVNISSGQFNTTDSVFLGVNAGARGTINQTGGTVNIGNELALGRSGGTGVVDISGGTMNVPGWTAVGGGRDGGAGTGTLTVRDSGVFNHPQLGGDLLNGWQNGSSGTINILNGGVMTYNWWLRSGIDGGSTGKINIDGVGSTFYHNNGTGGDSRVLIGEGGTGELNISDFGQYIHGGSETRVGWHNGSVGKVEVKTSGVMTLNNGALFVGSESGSVGTVNVKTGGKISINNGWLQIGESTGSTGTVTVDGVGSLMEHDTVQAGHSMSIGQSGTGTLTISNGAVFNDGGSRVLVGRDSTGVGNLNVLSGGTFNHFNALDSDDWSLYIGGTHEFNGTGHGFATVSGTGSTLNSNAIQVGRNGGTGVFNIANGGTVNTRYNFDLGRTGGIGTGNMAGGTLNVGRTLYVGVGGTGTFNKSGGTVNVTNQLDVGRDGTGTFTNSGGNATVNGFYVGNGTGAVGTVNITDGTVQNNGWVDIGALGRGTVNVTGSNAKFLGSTSDMQIGTGTNGQGTVNIAEGGQMTHNWWINIGRGGGSVGHVTVDGLGSKLTQGTRDNSTDSRLNIGADPNDANNAQTGTLTISNEGLVERTMNGGEINVGRNVGSTGTLTIESGGRLISAGGTAFVGVNGGTGTMTLSDEGSEFRHTGDLYIGLNPGSVGSVEHNAGLVAVNNLRVGTNAGNGTYSIFDGTVTVPGDLTIGWQGAATGVMNVSGGTVTVNTDTYVGVDGTATGTLTIDGGNLTTGHVIVARDAGNTGTVQLDAGTLATNFITNAAGTAQVNFNGATVQARSNRSNFFEGFTTANSQLQAGGGLVFDSNGFTASATNNFDGPGGITKIGAGTLAVAGANIYTGATNLDGGTLLLGANNAIPAASALNLSSGTTLATGGFSNDTGALSVNGAAVIDMAGGDSVLNFANVGTWTALLSVWNYTGASWTPGTDKLTFTLGSGSINLANVEFYSDNGVNKIGSGGGGLIGNELVPVPEPAAILAAGLLGVHILRRETRRRKRSCV